MEAISRDMSISAEDDLAYSHASDMMSSIQSLLKKGSFIRREFVSVRPIKEFNEYRMVLVSPLFNIRGQEVGDIRVFVFSPLSNNYDKLVRVEWSLKPMGFWFRRDFVGSKYGPRDVFKRVSGNIRTTTERSISLKSQNRMLKKVKRNMVRDKALKSGLVMG